MILINNTIFMVKFKVNMKNRKSYNKKAYDNYLFRFNKKKPKKQKIILHLWVLIKMKGIKLNKLKINLK